MGQKEYRDAVLADRPALYAPFGYFISGGGAVRDQTRKNADGTFNGIIALDIPGPFAGGASAANFPGTDDNILAFADNANLDLGDAWSMECWYRPESLGVTQAIISKGDGAYFLRQNAADNTIHSLNAQIAGLASSVQAVAAGKWDHIVATKNGAARFIYFNGNDSTAALPGDNTSVNTTANLWIGTENSAGGVSPMFGVLAHIAVYNRALGRGEVMSHYTAARSTRRRRHI